MESVAQPQPVPEDEELALCAAAGAAARRDERELARLLTGASSSLLQALFASGLPRWVEDAEQLEVLQNGPGELWRVNWGTGTTRVLPPLLRSVAKRFPAGAQVEPGVLHGETIFGFDPAAPPLGTATPTRVRPVGLRAGPGGRALRMTYAEPPYFSPATGAGFHDAFLLVSPDLVIAQGSWGEYRDEDLPEGTRRGALARLLAPLADRGEHDTGPRALAFWMQRVRLVSGGVEPVWAAQ